MEQSFITVSPGDFSCFPFRLIGREWMLLTAGRPGHCNPMTASWGGFGVLWHKPVATCYIRPQRYTFEFMEQYSRFTLSFFGPEGQEALQFCGANSGRDFDKIARTGLTPVTVGDAVGFAQARLIIAARKIYYQDLNPAHFLEAEIHQFYPGEDFHRMVVGEVETILARPDHPGGGEKPAAG